MATSKDGTPGDAGSLGAEKGITLLRNRRYATSHLAAVELEGEADPCRTGTVPLKEEYMFCREAAHYPGKSTQVRTLSGEISSIYKKAEKPGRCTA